MRTLGGFADQGQCGASRAARAGSVTCAVLRAVGAAEVTVRGDLRRLQVAALARGSTPASPQTRLRAFPPRHVPHRSITEISIVTSAFDTSCVVCTTTGRNSPDCAGATTVIDVSLFVVY